MAATSQQGPIIYSIGEPNNGDPGFTKALEERLKDILGKFKDNQSVIYVNIEKVVLDNPERSRSRSRNRSRSRSGSRSRSRSHSHHRKGKHHGRHHSRGPRGHHGRRHHFPPHFLMRHHGHQRFPHQYYSSEVEETCCDVTTGADTAEECSAVENSCRRYRRDRRHSRSRSRGGRSRSKSKGKKNGKKCCKKDKQGANETEEQEVINIDIDEPKPQEELEQRFDSLNVSKSS